MIDWDNVENVIEVSTWFINEIVESDGGEIRITEDEARAIWNDGFLCSDIGEAWGLWDAGLIGEDDDFGMIWEDVWNRCVAWVRARRTNN